MALKDQLSIAYVGKLINILDSDKIWSGTFNLCLNFGTYYVVLSNTRSTL